MRFYMLYIYLLSISPIWNDTDEKLLPFISPSRRERIAKYHYDKDRKLSLYAALLVRMQLNKLTNIPNTELSFSYGQYQKPYFQPDRHLHFNIPHTHNKILCAITSQPVGVDIEKKSTAPVEIMKLVFHPTEIEYVQSSLTEADKLTRFYTIWTKKEALTKCIGTGLTDDISTVNTLAACFTPNFHTWINKEYICSVYCNPIPKRDSYFLLSESDIHHFFLV